MHSIVNLRLAMIFIIAPLLYQTQITAHESDIAIIERFLKHHGCHIQVEKINGQSRVTRIQTSGCDDSFLDSLQQLYFLQSLELTQPTSHEVIDKMKCTENLSSLKMLKFVGNKEKTFPSTAPIHWDVLRNLDSFEMLYLDLTQSEFGEIVKRSSQLKRLFIGYQPHGQSGIDVWPDLANCNDIQSVTLGHVIASRINSQVDSAEVLSTLRSLSNLTILGPIGTETLVSLSQLPELTRLTISSTEADLSCLADFEKLKVLEIGGASRIHKEDVKNIAQIPNIKALHFNRCLFPDALNIFAPLKSMESLEELSLLQISPTNDVFDLSFINTLPNLRTLRLRGFKGSFESIYNVRQLASLSIDSCEVFQTDKFAHCKNIEKLVVCYTPIMGESDLPSSLTHLEIRAFSQTPVPKSFFRRVFSLPNLQVLTLNGVKIGVNDFQKLTNHSRLLALDLSGSTIDSEAIPIICQLPKLECLKLSNVKLKNLHSASEIARWVDKSKNLKTLDITGMLVCDALIASLTKCRQLHTLNLSQSDLSEDMLIMLNQAPSLGKLDMTLCKNFHSEWLEKSSISTILIGATWHP